MNQVKYVLSQIVTFLATRIFNRYVKTFQCYKWIKHFISILKLEQSPYVILQILSTTLRDRTNIKGVF